MTDQVWSWIAAVIGLTGFWLSGKKLWWSWYINVVNQVAWFIFALITGYWAFFVTAIFYFIVFSRNAYLWTKEHFEEKKRIGALLADPNEGWDFNEYAVSPDVDRGPHPELLQGKRALSFLGVTTDQENDGRRHILRLEEGTPICERPNDWDTFVTPDFTNEGETCVLCELTINRWNARPL